MPLTAYVRPRLVALDSRRPALEAARAIENNQIGAVIAHDRGRVVGIVTDRDLALRVLGRGLDPTTTPISDVMSTDVATLSPADSAGDAIRIMLERNVRRIPLVDEDRLVGMVTLDDLILDEAVPLDWLAEVVQAQIGEGGPVAPARPGRERRGTRAEATYRRLLAQVRDAAGIESAAQAETALEVVLGALVQRLTPEEAKDLVSQLPSLLQPDLMSLPPGPDKQITRESMESALVQRLDVDPTRAAQLLAAIAATIVRNVSHGQMEDVRQQLPAPLRAVFSDSPPPAAP